MRAELPEDAREHFDDFIKQALFHDYAEQPQLRKHTRITSTPADGRVLLMRALLRGDQVSIHARIYLRGTYGVLFTTS